MSAKGHSAIFGSIQSARARSTETDIRGVIIQLPHTRDVSVKNIWSCTLKIKRFGYVGKVRLMHLSRQNESRQNEM